MAHNPQPGSLQDHLFLDNFKSQGFIGKSEGFDVLTKSCNDKLDFVEGNLMGTIDCIICPLIENEVYIFLIKIKTY